MNDLSIAETVQEYYGQTLQSNKDLKTSACCTIDTTPKHLRPLLSDLHQEVLDRFYGCGSPLPTALKDTSVLDLGCGSGRDCYLLSRLVGEQGRVIGVDMTDEQLAVANRHREFHTQKYNYSSSNVEFRRGHIEDLAAVDIADNSMDVVISNCVVNLSANKHQVLSEIFRVLKTGGELYFSDVYADRRVPVSLKSDPLLVGECLSGAFYWEDFRRIMQQLGCPDLRVVQSSPITLDDPEVVAKIGMVNFSSITVRAFKIPLEDRCEDFGQVAIYQGTMKEFPHAFDLDDHHHFETGLPLRICGNTADMLSVSRLNQHFDIVGDKSRHFGLFNCAPPSNSITTEPGASCC